MATETGIGRDGGGKETRIPGGMRAGGRNLTLDLEPAGGADSRAGADLGQRWSGVAAFARRRRVVASSRPM